MKKAAATDVDGRLEHASRESGEARVHCEQHSPVSAAARAAALERLEELGDTTVEALCPPANRSYFVFRHYNHLGRVKASELVTSLKECFNGSYWAYQDGKFGDLPIYVEDYTPTHDSPVLVTDDGGASDCRLLYVTDQGDILVSPRES